MPITIEIRHDIHVDEAKYQYILPALHRLLTNENTNADELWADYQSLLEFGLTDQGKFTIPPCLILAALNFVPFEEEMNRVPQF